MSFIQNAQEVLPEQIAQIREIMSKVALGENSVDELIQLTEFQKTVAAAVANRDKMKNLSFLNGKVYTIEEVLQAGGYSEEEQKQYFKKAFKPAAVAAAVFNGEVGTYKINNVDTKIEFKSDSKLNKATKEEFAKLPIKVIAAGFTPAFKTHITKAKKLNKGVKAGELRYPEVALFAKRMGIDSVKLMKELALVEGKPAEPAKA